MVQQCRQCGQMHDPDAGCTFVGRAPRPTLVGEDELLVGNVVAERYRVDAVLGQGSTGTVFAVEHTSFARAAAMKVLRPRYASAEVVSRVFHGEARASFCVTHPGLTEVFDIGTLPDGSHFFVMERLEGETLAARVARERLSVAAGVDMMMQLLSAIAAIHSRDLLLRDLRPQNIYLAHRRGCRPLLKLLDVGLARLTSLDLIARDWDATQTSGSAAVGPHVAAHYLSPERTRGEHAVTPASDLFVAAVIFYEALTGERPFKGKTFDSLLAQIVQGSPPPLHEVRSDLSPELGTLVSRALSNNQRSRPASAKEMQDDLRAIFEGGRRTASTTSMRAVVVAPPASLSESVEPPAPSPLDAHLRVKPNPRPSLDEAYLEDTDTKRDAFDGYPPAIPAGNASLPAMNEEEVLTQARQLDPQVFGLIDEASAENSDRTVPPPPADASIEVDVSGLGITPGLQEEEEEETETQALRPDLRARVDALLANRPTPRAFPPLSSTAPLQPPPKSKPRR